MEAFSDKNLDRFYSGTKDVVQQGMERAVRDGWTDPKGIRRNVENIVYDLQTTYKELGETAREVNENIAKINFAMEQA